MWTGTRASDGTIVLDRSADEIKSTNTGGLFLHAYSNLTADCSSYSVFANAKTGVTGSSHRVGVLGRWLDTSGGNGYCARIGGDATWHLEKYTNGTITILDSGSIAGFGSGATYYDIELRMTGTTIAMYIDDVLKGSETDTTHTTGTHGVFLRNGFVRMTSTSAVYP